jgi:hypothetical protein
VAKRKGSSKSADDSKDSDNRQWLRQEYRKEKQLRKEETPKAVKPRAVATSSKVATPKPKKTGDRAGANVDDYKNLKEHGGTLGKTRYKFSRAPPEDTMYEADPSGSPRLFKWLVDNKFIEPVSNYRTVRGGNRQTGGRKTSGRRSK